MTNDDLVNVLVPRRYLSQVYGFIANLDEHPPSRGATSRALPTLAETNKPVLGQTDEWTASRLRRMVEESSPAMVSVLAALAARPGQWLTMKELAAAVGPDADWNTVAGTLGAFGRRVRSRYGLETWPFESRFDFEVEGRVCRMNDEIASLVKRLIADL